MRESQCKAAPHSHWVLSLQKWALYTVHCPLEIIQIHEKKKINVQSIYFSDDASIVATGGLLVVDCEIGELTLHPPFAVADQIITLSEEFKIQLNLKHIQPRVSAVQQLSHIKVWTQHCAGYSLIRLLSSSVPADTG